MVSGVESYQGIRKFSQVGHKRFPISSSSRESLYTAASPSNDLSSVKTPRDILPHQRRNKDTTNKGKEGRLHKIIRKLYREAEILITPSIHSREI
ncbi:hypothetical protein CEXT_505971 [Caerostris extrusa]|uniref:Uncharacterized protein n=1 Tax=Caerostris extrusa TaxID=172846 RepID=A0AAV4WQV9_CAEEX|nr:hypothetical protein CEXT_505971 [Caerostris extrusa]